MALIICKKCKKIVASTAESCPYCGEANPGEAANGSGSIQVNLRNAVIAFLIIVLLVILLFQWSSKPAASDTHGDSAASIKSSCLSKECPAGTKAVTYTTQQEPFYQCKSGELSEYANFVLGVMIKQVRYADIAPVISGKTGEPAVQGDDKLLLDKYRAKAGVASFEEALSKCYRGVGNLKVAVLYSPAASNSIYVAAEDDRENKFWLPKARLFRQ